MTFIRSQNDEVNAYLQSLANGDSSSAKSILAAIQKQKQKLDDEGEALKGSSGNDAGTGGNYIPMSMAAGIIAAFLAMITYGNEINQQQNQLSQSWAKAMMGETTDSAGHVTISVDDSLAGHWFNSAVSAGNAQAAGLVSQGIGALVGAVAGGVALLAMGGNLLKDTAKTAPINSELEGAKAYRSLFDNPRRPELVAGEDGEVPMRDLRPSPEVQECMDQMKSGAPRRYRSREGVEADEVAKEAVAHLAGSDQPGFQRAMRAADKRVSELQKAAASQQTFSTNLNLIDAGNRAAQSGGQAYGSYGQATQAAIQAQQKAQSDVAQQNLQQVQGSSDKAVQSAQANHDSANSIATSLGQTLQATNR